MRTKEEEFDALFGGADRGRQLSAAVRRLRHILGESQEAFARRMNTAVRTIARYETTRPPKGKILGELVNLARERGQYDLEMIFFEALMDDLGVGPAEIITPAIQVPLNPPRMYIRPQSEEEAAIASAAIAVWRDDKDRSALETVIGPAIEAIKFLREREGSDLFTKLKNLQKGNEGVIEACRRLNVPFVRQGPLTPEKR